MKVEIFNKIPGNFKFENLVGLNKNVVKIQIKQSILKEAFFLDPKKTFWTKMV